MISPICLFWPRLKKEPAGSRGDSSYQQEMWQEFNRKQQEERERIEAERVKQPWLGDKLAKPTPITKTDKDKIERNAPCPAARQKYKNAVENKQ